MSQSVATLIPGESADVLGLDERATLDRIRSDRADAEAAAARELRAVTHWADLHRTDGEVGAVDPMLCSGPERMQGRSILGREAELRLLGEGAFTVQEFAITELAAALGLSEPAARCYVAQALELRERLPRLWARVQSGGMRVWVARRVAEETIPLTREAADYVDRHLAPFAGKVSVRRILRAVAAAVQRHDPELARERADAAAGRRGVWVEVEASELAGTGTGLITAVASSVDAAAFDAAVGRVAAELAHLGDTDAEQLRRSKAIGVLADSQYALDLRETAEAAGPVAAGAGPLVGDRRPRRSSTSQPAPVVHIHLHLDAVTGPTASGQGEGAVARTPFGSQPLSVVEQWLRDLAPGSQVRLTPVVDLAEHISVDAYEAPDRLRDQVDHRDATCMFPWCGRRGRYDLDHIEEYLPLDEGGPPGQTSTANTQKLCRFHHRVKTHGDWDVERAATGHLLWTSPLGERYGVDGTGTRSLPRSRLRAPGRMTLCQEQTPTS